jgi:hypothetical protein
MADSAYPDALPAHYRLHWYVLERVLGQGGFGITYLARDSNLDQAVAIKEYLPVDVATRRADATVQPRSEEQSERYRWGLDRFIREARTLAKFDHPNIVRVLSVFEQNGTAYMLMRFEEGENFAALLDRKRMLGEDELLRVLLPVLDGLKLVHEAGFIHRDIKPDNIHIRADGSPVLLDFGSARHALGHARTVTILVAPGYAPFEQYYSSGEDQGPWTDIYSLGATCYRAIAGVPPMDAIARSKGILGSTRELLVPATAIGSGRYSERFLKAVDHALAFAEKDRPGTIAQWRRELIGDQPAALPQTRPATSPAAALAPDTRKTPVTRTAASVALIAGIAVIAGGFGAYIYMERIKKQESPPVAANQPAPRQTAPVTVTLADQAQKEKEKRAQADAERAAQAERDRQEAQRKAEEAERDRQRAPEEQQRRDAEKAQKARERAGNARPKSAPVQVTKVEPQGPPAAVSVPATPAPAPLPECPQQGDVAIYNCYRALALGGDASAALKVGELFEAGRGVGQSNNWAYYWYLLAEQRSADGARSRKEAIAKRLQKIEIEQVHEQLRTPPKPGK